MAATGAHFRVWAPAHKTVQLVVDGESHTMDEEQGGYFSLWVAGAAAGSRYGFRFEGDPKLYPDPASWWQPDGPHGPSAVYGSDFRWTDRSWTGLAGSFQVIYEMHLGTFTTEGSWASAAEHLEYLADLGVTIVEVMPVAEFSGRFGWGYDGVDLWAPFHRYGNPDEFRAFVDRAHEAGLGVILDVVYNHVGPDGNYLTKFTPDYFTDRYPNEWGEPFNLDGPNSAPVREFILANAAYWIREFHLDGLRVDATQNIFDSGPKHILGELTRVARAAAGEKRIFITAENEPQDIRIVRPVEQNGHGFNSVWNDDFHHSARVALTGVIDAYYSDYRGSAQEFISLARHGFLYQGQWYGWQNQPRGTPSIGAPGSSFVWYLQNHDQVANSGEGKRLHDLASPGSVRAMTALLLLGPANPLIFQGQEFGSSAPFLYFADHNRELAELVEKGRLELLSQFRSVKSRAAQSRLPAPHHADTFERCKLDHNERKANADVLALHRDLLALRKNDAVFSNSRHYRLEGSVLGARALLLRYFHSDGIERILVVNLGETLIVSPVPEPLLAPPEGRHWTVMWSSEAPEYGGEGMAELEPAAGWKFPAQAAIVLEAAPGSWNWKPVRRRRDD